MKKWQLLENVTISKLWYGWVGIGTSSEWKKILIKWGALPNSIVHCRITKKKKDYIEAMMMEVVSYDTQYTDGTIVCAHYKNPLETIPAWQEHEIWCGWCKRQIMSYDKQCEIKQHLVEDSFRWMSEIIGSIGWVQHIIWSPLTYQYRNKIEFSFGKYLVRKKWTKKDEKKEFLLNHQRQVGFHKQWYFSKVLDVQQCHLVSEKAHEVFVHLKKIIHDSWLPVYDQKMHTWVLRHLVIREWSNTGHIMVNLVMADKNFDNSWYQALRDTLLDTLSHDEFAQKAITTFLITTNNWLADIVRNGESSTKLLRWEGTIMEKLVFTVDEEIRDITFRVSPFAFFQTNTFAAQLLFSTAAQTAWGISGTILDLYCGSGSIGLSFLKLGIGKSVVWIEIVEDAIVDAKHNARINGFEDNTYFVAGKAEELVFKDSTVKEQLKWLELIVVDPPRDWLHPKVVTFLNSIKREYSCKLLYISCNPVTMARDIQWLTEGDWTLKSLQPVDMFPQTHHIECIGLMV